MPAMMIRRFLIAFLLSGVFAFATGCAAGEPRVELKGREFAVDLARTPQEQARGLMFVEEMPADRGMLFIFPSEAPRAFWMKNTRIALDILYFDAELSLVAMALNARPCAADPCPNYPSRAPARYVLELNAGTAEGMGLEHGDRLTLLFEP